MWSSRIPDLLDAFPGAVDTGLVAGGAVLTDAVKDELRGGYTTGDFVTGNNINSVYATDPATEAGVRVVRVTTRQTDPPYPWWWETGHFNLWLSEASGGALASQVGTQRQGRFVRVEKWRPASEKSADAVAQAFVATVHAALAPFAGPA